MATKARQSFARKIVDLDTLCRHREMARRSNRTVVHCHGCFDIVHPGHIRYLQYAKQQGDVLVVSLTGDPHVGKGEGRPYVPQELRAENLAALEFVDYVFINAQPTAVTLLETLQPDIYMKGREYEHNDHPGFLKEKAAVEAKGGRVIFSSGDVVYSSSQIIDNYAQRLDLEHEKLALFCQRYEITKDTLIALLDDVVDRPYVVVGDMILDRYQYCDATDVAADAPMMSLVPLERRDFLGGAAMVARHLAGLGAEVTLITSLGSDEASDAAIDNLESMGVNILPVRNRKKIAVKTRFVVETQKIFQLDESPSTPTDSANEKWMLEKLGTLGSSETALLMYDAGLGLLTDSVAQAVIAQRGAFSKLIGGTAGPRGRLLRLTDADLAVVSERGVRLAMRDYEQGLSSIAWRLMTETRMASMMMPLGKKGLLCFDSLQNLSTDGAWERKLRSEYLASPFNGTVDKLGFDEALLAIAGAIFGAGGNLHQSAYIALAAALLEARHMGHHPLDGHELSQLIQSRQDIQ